MVEEIRKLGVEVIFADQPLGEHQFVISQKINRKKQ
jgi:hypothetical protein